MVYAGEIGLKMRNYAFDKYITSAVQYAIFLFFLKVYYMVSCIKCGYDENELSINENGLCELCVIFNKIKQDNSYCLEGLAEIRRIANEKITTATNEERENFEASLKKIENHYNFTVSFGVGITNYQGSYLSNYHLIFEKGKDELLNCIMIDVERTGFFKPEKFDDIENCIKKMIEKKIYTTEFWKEGGLLTKKEKLELKLETRNRYYKEYIGYLSEKGLSWKEPEKLLYNFWNKYLEMIKVKYDTN